MKTIRLISLLLIMANVLSGCTVAQDVSSHASIKTPIESSSAYISIPKSDPSETEQLVTDPDWDEKAVRKGYEQAEPWQQVYYDFAVAELEHEALALELYFPKSGDPLMAIVYGITERSGEQRYVAWRINDGRMEKIFEETAYYLIFDKESGVLMAAPSSGPDPERWGKTLIKNSGSHPYDGADVSLRLTLHYYDELGSPTIKRRLADFFLDTYQPVIPQGAPDWVKEYVKFIHTHLDGPYMLDEPDFRSHGTIRGMILFESGPNQAPIMYATDISGEYYYLGDKGRFTAYHIYGLNGATLYQDEYGQRVIELESSYTNWHIMGKPVGISFLAKGSSARCYHQMYTVMAKACISKRSRASKRVNGYRKKEHKPSVKMELGLC